MQVQEDSRNQEDYEQEQYKFLQEILKNEKKITSRSMLFKVILLGLLFGIFFSIGFFFLGSWMRHGVFKKIQTIEFSVPEMEEVQEEIQEVFLKDYQEIAKELRGIGEQAMKSMVEVGCYDTEDWKAGGDNLISGIVIADNGPEFLILVGDKYFQDKEKVRIIFPNHQSHIGMKKQSEESLGLSIYAVDKMVMKKETRKSVELATLGSSKSLKEGELIIAIGRPFGYTEAMGFGVVASANQKVSLIDGEYQLISTDIIGAKTSSGVLVNTKGEILGLIRQPENEEEESRPIAAYGISQLREIIQFLSNGKKAPYLGVTGIEVTDEIAEEQNLPVGIYVQSVEPDSPGMRAGIQTGDIITNIGKYNISTMEDYHRYLMKQTDEEIKIQGVRIGNGEQVQVEYTVLIENSGD